MSYVIQEVIGGGIAGMRGVVDRSRSFVRLSRACVEEEHSAGSPNCTEECDQVKTN